MGFPLLMTGFLGLTPLDTKGEPSCALRRKHFATNCCHDTPMTLHGQGSRKRRFQDDMKASASACCFFHRVEGEGEDEEADEFI